MQIELHCHSRCSDGSHAPAEVARRAAAAGVELFCLTDHDTWDGHAEAEAALAGTGVRALRGLELTCHAGGRTVHVLLYGIADGPALAALSATLHDLRTRRRTRLQEICARFQRWDIQLDAAAILEAAGEATPGRPHVAAALVKAGVCRSVTEAFDRFLYDGGPADVPAPRLDVAEGVQLARATGARLSLAHPHSAGTPAMVRVLYERCRPLGLDGIEAIYGPSPPRRRAEWLRFAEDLGLVVTAGSDFHGISVQPDIPQPGIELPAPHAERLREWLGR